MALGLNFAVNSQPNLVLAPAPMVCRIAAGAFASAQVVGTFSVSGSVSAHLTWSLSGAPAGGSVALVPQVGALAATLTFNNVPQRVAPYLLIVTVTDGTSQVQTALALLVRPSLNLILLTSDTASPSRISGSGSAALPWTVTGLGYDASLPSLQLAAQGNGQILTDAQFLAPDPANLLPGLSFQTAQDGTVCFAVAQPELEGAWPAGGLRVAAQTEAVSFQVYHPDTLYDSPSNALQAQVVYALTGAAAGLLSAGLGGSFDPDSDLIRLGLEVDYLGGQAPAYSIQWGVSDGAQGSWVGGVPGPAATSAEWSGSGSATQSLSFTATLTDPTHLAAPLVLSAGPFELAPAGSWLGTTALQVQLPQGTNLTQDLGKTAWLEVALPDLQPTEQALVTLTVASIPIPQASDPSYTFPIAAGADPRAFFGFPLPLGATEGQKWQLNVSAQASTETTTRSGFGTALLVCTGASELQVSPAASGITAAVAELITPVPVTVQAWQQQAQTPATLAAMAPDSLTQCLANGPNAVNSVLVPVPGASLALVGGPTGLSCSGGALGGRIPQPGSYQFSLAARAPGYRTGFSGPLSTGVSGTSSFVGVTWSNPAFVFSGGNLALNWSTSGAPDSLQLQQSTSAASPAVVSSWVAASGTPVPLQQAMPLPATEALILMVSNTLGSAYSQPIVVQPSQASASALPIAPVTATVDLHNGLTLDWTPPAIDNVTYSSWTVWVESGANALPFALPDLPGTPGRSLQAVDGPGPGNGYQFTAALGSSASGYLALQMQASGGGLTSPLWDSYNAFPAAQGSFLSKSAADIGEPVTIFLEPAAAAGTGPTGDTWWVEVQNGTQTLSSAAIPLTITAIPMSLPASMAGANTVTSFISKTYLNSDGTRFTLVRSFQLASPLVISNATYLSNPLASTPTPGFDIAGADGQVPTPEPYLAVAPVLVRDETTHELKLLLATARGASASSQFGTLAADVFPLPGRPHTLDPLQQAAVSSVPLASVAAPLQIQTSALEDAMAGQPVTPFQFQAQGGQAPYQWFAANLPQGMYLSRDGIMTGASLQVGAFQVVVSVQDAQSPAFLAQATLPLFVGKSNVAIVGALDSNGNASPSLPVAYVGSLYHGGLQAAKGILPYTWSLLAGSLPPGLSLDPATGLITGWASTNDSVSDFGPGVFNPTFEVTDAVGASVTQVFPMDLEPMLLTLGASDQQEIVMGVDTVVRIPVTGGRPGYGFTPLPSSSGLSLALRNGVLQLSFPRSFVATSSSSSDPQTSVGVTVTDQQGTAVSRTYTFVMKAASPAGVPAWLTPAFPTVLGPSSDGTDQVSFGPVPSGDDAPALEVDAPAWLLVDDTSTDVGAAPGVVTLLLATSGQNQELTLRATARNGAGAAYGQMAREYSVVAYALVNGLPTFAITPLPVSLGEFFAFDPQCPGRNSPPPSIPFTQVSLAPGATLPEGVSLDSVSGLLYGAIQTLPSQADGNQSTTLYLTLGTTQVGVLAITWNVYPASLSITPLTVIPGAYGLNSPDVVVGQPYVSSRLGVSPSSPVVLAVSGATANQINPVVTVVHGSLPRGITPYVVQGSGSTLPTIQLIGSATESGAFDPVLLVTDAADLTRCGLFKTRIVVSYQANLILASTGDLAIASGLPFTTTLAATGGLPPYTWSVASNPSYPAQLPAGLNLNPATGVLSGTTRLSNVSGPAGLVNFQVADGFGHAVTQPIQLTVAPAGALAITSVLLPGGVVGGVYEAPLTATGGVPNPAAGLFSWTASSSLPPGLSLSPSGVLSGIPTGSFSGTVTVTVTDSALPTPGSSSATLPLVIGASGTPQISAMVGSAPAALPTGTLATPYGSAARTSSLYPTGSSGSMAPSAPGFAWGVAAPVTVGGVQFLLELAGFRRPYVSSYALSTRQPVPPAAPLYCNPNPTVGAMPNGAWGVMPGSAFDPVTLNHMLSAGCPVSPSEILVCGGVANDQCASQALGTVLNQAALIGFKAGADSLGNLIPIPDGSCFTTSSGGNTILSSAFQLPLNPLITARYGHVAVQLGLDSVLLCGGLGRNPDGSRNASVQSNAVWLLSLTRPSPGTGTPTSAVWTSLAPMPVGLAFHSATLLADGRVLVVGGVQDFYPESSDWLPSATGQGSNLCLVYNPTSSTVAGLAPNTWAVDQALPIQVLAPALVTLPNGQVLLAAPAGPPSASLPTNQVNGIPLSSANCLQVYTPASASGVGSWSAYPTLASAGSARDLILWGASAHGFGAGMVLFTGGERNLTGLQGNLFTAALVPDPSQVLSSPSLAAYYLSTNTEPVVVNEVHLVASGGVPPYHNWSASPALPTGLTLDPDTGQLYGTPEAATPLNQVYSFSVTDSRSPAQVTGSTTALSLVVTDPAAPVWTTPAGVLTGSPFIQGPNSVPGGTQASAVAALLQASAPDGGGISYQLSGSIPGLGLNGATGLLSGMPTQAGVFSFSVAASNATLNANGRVDTTAQAFQLSVYGNLILTAAWTGRTSPVYLLPNYAPGLPYAQAPQVNTPATFPEAFIGTAYPSSLPYASFAVLNGTGPYTWSCSGLANTGLSFTGSGSTAMITGTPTEVGGLSSVNVPLLVTVTDASGVTQAASIVMPVGESPLVVSTPPTAVVGQAYSTTLALSGGIAPYTVTGVSGLPSGLTLNLATLLLSGTPVYADLDAGAAATATLTLTVSDSGDLRNTSVSTPLLISPNSYSWASGPQVELPGIWAGSGYDFHTGFLPLGIAWDRFPSTGASNIGPHAQDAAPWTVRVTGVFATGTPTLSFASGGYYQGMTWSATRIQNPAHDGSLSTAIFEVLLAPQTPSGPWTGAGPFSIGVTLNDGSPVDAGFLGGIWKVAGPGSMDRPDGSHNVLQAGGSVIGLTTYTG